MRERENLGEQGPFSLRKDEVDTGAKVEQIISVQATVCKADTSEQGDLHDLSGLECFA